jgi:hypothetical protein
MITNYKLDYTRVWHETHDSGIIIDVSSIGAFLVRFDELPYGKDCLYCDPCDLEYEENDEDDYDYEEENEEEVTDVDFEEDYTFAPMLPLQLITPKNFYTQTTNDLLLLLI